MRMKHRIKILASLWAVALIGIGYPASAVDVAVYQFSGDSAASSDVDGLTTAGDWVQTVGAIVNNRVQANGIQVDNSLASSLTNMEYGGFTFNTNGSTLDLSQLTLDYGGENPFASQLHVFASTDGGATGFALGDQLFTLTNVLRGTDIESPPVVQVVNSTFDLGAISALQGLSGQVEFRIYLNDASSSSARVHFLDNITLTALASTVNDPRWNLNADGNWNTSSNWDPASTPGSGANVVLGDIITADRTVTLDSNVTLNRIAFSGDQGSYSLNAASGQSIILTGDGEIRSSGAHAINARISGSVGVTKTGGGSVVLSNAGNNYTGGTNIRGGELEVTSTGALQGAVDIARIATLALGGDGSGGGYNGSLANSLTGSGRVVLSDTLTTEVVAIGSAKAFAGDVVINGGTLSLTNGGGLGTGGSAGSATSIAGGESSGKLAISGNITVANELLTPAARTNDAVHFTSSGNNAWNGNIAAWGAPGEINIESTAGTLTLGGLISATDDANRRTFVFSGAGNTNVTGIITDDGVAPDGVTRTSGPVRNVNLVKRGSGTLTISTASNNVDDYHRGSTVVEEGTLAITADGGTIGELSSESVVVQAGATLDLSSFSVYNMQAEAALGYVQVFGGGGTINANTFGYFDDATLTPGDGAGTLTLNGNLNMSTFTVAPIGSLNFELSNVTTVGSNVNDLIDVNGTLTANTNGGGRFAVKVTPVDGGLASGAYRLIEYNGALAGNATGSDFDVSLADGAGNPVGASRQTFAVSTATAGQVNLLVSGAAKNLVWSGNGSDPWDTALTGSWNGGADQYYNLDNVVFDDTSVQKTVGIAANVMPASIDVNTSSTYTFTGAGIVGSPDINVSSGTLVLNNSGNTFRGTVTVATGASLQVGNGSADAIRLPANETPYVVNGTLAINELSGGETINGPISGSGQLRVDSSTLALGGDNSGFTGSIVAAAGTTLAIDNIDTGSPLGSTTGSTTIGLGATLQALGQTGTIAEPVTLNGGRLRVGGAASNLVWSGNVTVGAGDEANTAEVRLDGGAGAVNTSGLTFAGNIVGSNGSDVRFSVGDGSTMAVTGNVQHGAGRLLKNGAGIVELHGANSHTGDTVVEEGTVALVGSSNLAASSLVEIQQLGILDVSGSTGGSYGVPSGQKLNLSGAVVGNATAMSGSTIAIGGDGRLESIQQTVTVTPPNGATSSNSDVAVRLNQGNGNDTTDLSMGSINALGVFRSLLTYDLASTGITDPSYIDAVSLTMTLFSPNGAQVALTPPPTLELHQLAEYNSDNVSFASAPAFGDVVASIVGPNFAGGYVAGRTLEWREESSGDFIDAIKGALGDKLYLGAKVDDTSEAAGTRSFYFLHSAEDPSPPRLEITFTDPSVSVPLGIGSGVIEGDLTTDANSVLAFDVFDAGLFDTLNVNGNALLNGILAIDLLDINQVAENETFTILTANGITNNLTLGGPDGNLFNLTASTSSELILTFVGAPEALPGDFNADGVVDAADYTVWRDNLGADESTNVLNGNGNGGVVDGSDYNLWTSQYGSTAGAAALAGNAVPEPASIAALLLGLTTVYGVARRR